MELSPDIDALLERYLALLDDYTNLRAELSRLQTATFQNLARANFAAERGVRFGQDYFDARMQAGRRVMVGLRDAGADVVTVEVIKPGATTAAAGSGRLESEAPFEEDEEGKKAREGEDEPAGVQKQKTPPPPKDPIRWFGLLTPLALRQTQASAVDAVERVIPRLVTVDAEMRQVEIEVRRARKRRAKAEAAAAVAAAVKQEASRTEVAASLSLTSKVSG